MSNYAVIAAAGTSRRFGQAKQFYHLMKQPLLLYALNPFEGNKGIKSITIVVPQSKIAYTKNLVKKWGYKKIRHIVAGGERRQDSVLNGLNTIMEKSGIVCIHDGCRPLISPTIVNRGIKLCRKYRAVIFGVPIYDTVKRVKKNRVLNTEPHSGLYLIQTPQFFNINLIKNAYKKANLAIDYTDEAAILESLGWSVYFFRGDRFNIKITEKSDLKALNKFLA